MLLAIITAAYAAEFTPAVTAADLDLPQCAAYGDARALGPAPDNTLDVLLGLHPPREQPAVWTTGPVLAKYRRFRVAFTHPVEIGTICTLYAGSDVHIGWGGTIGQTSVSVLKADAPYPGDVTKDAQWLPLPNGVVKVLPVGTTTRALRFTEYYAGFLGNPQMPQQPASSLAFSLLFKERYYSALELGTGKVFPTTNKTTPDRWEAYWIEPQTLAGIVCLGPRAKHALLDTMKPECTDPAALAPATAWKHLPDIADINGGPTLYSFDKPIATRALRVQPTAGGLDFGYTMGVVLPLSTLGDAPAPPQFALPVAPFKFTYTMPMEGFIAINIADKQTGRHLRRLVAEVARGKGIITEPWDLKDDQGQYVLPGDYTWSAIARPPLKLTYEISVNNAGQPAWWAPVKGGGGWMADHTPPIAVAAGGDVIFMGSPVGENGQAAIATDLDGNKLWGENPVLDAWGGADRIAADDKYGYLVNFFGVERVEAHTFAKKTIHRFTYTRDIPGQRWEGTTGAAVHGDRLAVGISAPPIPWLQSTFTGYDLDPKKCLPMVRRALGNRANYPEADYDELMQCNAALLTGSDPDAPEGFLPSAVQASLSAATGGALGGTITLVFHKPIAVGSVLLPDARTKVYALKPGKKLTDLEPNAEDGPGDTLGGGDLATEPFDEELWTPLTSKGAPGLPTVATTDKPLFTEALRIKSGPRLSYAMVLNRRFQDVAPQAERVYQEGEATENGGWAVQRDPKIPISPTDPAIMGLVWKTPVALRGVTLSRPSLASMAVDYWVGPDTADPKTTLHDDANWKQGGIIEAETFHGYWVETAAARTVDFNATIHTRALRIRAVAGAGAVGVRGMRAAIKGPHLAGFEALVAYTPLGGDLDLPPALNQRITELKLPAEDNKPAEVIRYIPLSDPGHLAYAADGVLYAVSGSQIVRIPADGPVQPVITAGLEHPTGIAFAADGTLAVVDNGAKLIKVCDIKTGKVLRTIGTPGGPQLGPWDPSRFDNPIGLTIDKNGKLWVADYSTQPKRISRWSPDGKIEKWFLGPAAYGGGGTMDPGDRSIVMYNGMKFRIDWTAKSWKLESILFRPGLPGSTSAAMPDRVIYVQGKRYLVGDEGVDGSAQVAVICTEKNGVAVPMVAAGNLGQWDDAVTRPDLKEKFARLEREKYGFCWVDANGDGVPQTSEVQITTANPLRTTYWKSRVGEDLSLNFAGARIRPTAIRPDGTLTYDLAKVETVPVLDTATWTAADGRVFVLSDALYAADGKTQLWEYPDNYLSVGGSKGVSYDRPAGVLVGEHQPIGHFTVGPEELWVTNGNHGDWFAFTNDGLLAAAIFGGPTGYGKRYWTMPEWKYGETDLSDVRLEEEHFQGFITKANDGNVYAIAGHNHNSIARVEGLEAMQRVKGAVAVTRDDIAKTQAWEVQKRVLERRREEPKIARVPYRDGGPAIDGSLDDWPDTLFLPIQQHYDEVNRRTVTDAEAALCFDNKKLYIAARVLDTSPLLNSSDNLNLLFKGGDAVDVTLGADPTADPNRTGPVAGDVRILLSRVKEKYVAVIYRFHVPGTPDDKRARFSSPVGESIVDVVTVLDDPEMSTQQTKTDYTLEAAIPWTALGVAAPRLGTKLRGDVGILRSDDNGMRTRERYYWSGKTQTIVADIPTEVRAIPALWGDLYFNEPDTEMRFGPDAGGGDLAP